MRHKKVVIDATHGLIHFSHLTMQVKGASSGANAKPQVVLIHHSLTVPPRTVKTIRAFVDHLLECKKTSTVTPVEKFTEGASLIISHSISLGYSERINQISETLPSGFRHPKILAR